MSFIPVFALKSKMVFTAAGAVAAAGLALWGYFTAKPEPAKAKCHTCKGKGVFVHKDGKTSPCLKCSAPSQAPVKAKCHTCKGKGVFVHKDGKKSPCYKCSAPSKPAAPVKEKKVCRACKGSGLFAHKDGKESPCKFCTKQPKQQKVKPEEGQKTVKGPREARPRIPVNHATRPDGHMDEGLRHRRHAIVHHEDDNGAGIGLHLLREPGGMIGVPLLPQHVEEEHPVPEGEDAYEDADDEASVATAPEEGSDAPADEEGQSSEEELEEWEREGALDFVVPRSK